MRLRKGSIRGRVKGDLPIVFTAEKLSAYGGLELFRRFVDGSGFAEQLREVFSIRRFESEEQRTALYDAVYGSTEWTEDISPRLNDVLVREAMVVTRIEPTKMSVLQ